MAVDFYADQKIFSLHSDDLTVEGDYTVTVRAFGPTNTPSNVSFDFIVSFINPCKIATFTIDPAILNTDIQYELGADTQIETLDLNKISSSVNDPQLCPNIQVTVLDVNNE